ncbi:unnamed protein product [Paramecium pentaurelia]|uniref:Uncharacterized protein n=1 Tax=Paramecium pentaurelia TaxID=43138 RepID=A0A8S1SDA8_9CILI|nr:unnamed protein product [Paramecium pentaurelia]
MCENYCRMQLLYQLKQKKSIESNQPSGLYQKISYIVKKAKQQAQKSLGETQIQAVFNETRFQSSNRQQFYKQNKLKEIKYQISHLKTEQKSINFDFHQKVSRRYAKSITVQRDEPQNEQQYYQSPQNYRFAQFNNSPKKVIIFSQRATPQRKNINIGLNLDTLGSWRRNSQDSSK